MYPMLLVRNEGRDCDDPPSTLIHLSAWRNRLENSPRPLKRASSAARSGRSGLFDPSRAPSEPLLGAHPDFPNSFGSVILRTSPIRGSRKSDGRDTA